jgi:hypothetical protein
LVEEFNFAAEGFRSLLPAPPLNGFSAEIMNSSREF